MADSDVRKALVQAVKSLLDTYPLETTGKVAWENTKFNADDLDSWFRVSFEPTTPTPVTLGLGGRDRQSGFIQIDLNTGQDDGVQFFDIWGDRIRQTFVAGKAFTSGTATVTIQTVGMSGGRVFESWFRKSVTITFRTDLTRNPIL